MNVFQRVASRLGRLAGHAAALLLVLMFLHTLVEIALRPFGLSTFVLEEMLGYGVAAVAFLALALTLEDGGLVRVNLLLERLSRWPRARRAVELVAAGGTMIVTGMAIRAFGASVVRQYVRGYTSGTLADVPMWIPEGVLLLGLVLFWFQLVACSLRLVMGAENS